MLNLHCPHQIEIYVKTKSANQMADDIVTALLR